MEIVALKVAGAVFLTVSIMHILRALFKAKITANNFVVPLWLSVIASIAALLLAIFMFTAVR
ncbi:MAG: hypothetical protein Q8R48_06850 [Candidatus Omnitrophota bacterium]|nr:hypothetical protein [Candidatus Omnitrophota bacterium]